MGTAETLIPLTQGSSFIPAKRRLVKHSTSDNDAKFNSQRLRNREIKKMGLNHLSCSLTELNAKPCREKSNVVSPSSGLRRKQTVIRKVPSQTDMWECIRTNYTFLMKDDLVIACEKTKAEMSWCDSDSASITVYTAPKWTCTEFITRFNQLHDTLHRLQAEALEEKDKASFLKNMQNNLRSLWNDCQALKEQATLLEIRYPDMKDDINRRCNILNNKWEALQQAIWPKRQQKQNEVMAELTMRMKHIRRWLREVDNKLKDLKASQQWSMPQILEAYDNQKALQLEIETRGREVTSLLKRVAAPEGVSVESCKVLYGVVRNLERYWHTVWLQSLENHCLTEQILERKRNGNLKSKKLTDSSDTDFDEGPRAKYRRLTQDNTMSSTGEKSATLTMDMNSKSTTQDSSYKNVDSGGKQPEKSSKGTGTFSSTREVGTLCSVIKRSHPVSDKCIMVGTTGIAALKAKYGDDFSNFEIIQDVGYSSESSTHLSSDDVTEYIRVYSYSPPRKMCMEEHMAEAQRTIVAESAVPPFQRVFGHSSLGSTSSHNDSGFGPAEISLGDVSPVMEAVDENLQNCEWNVSQDIGSDISDGSLEEVLGFHLSFSEMNDNSPMSVGFTLDGFDSDGSSDFHNRSSFTSDAQAFYKVTSIDSENGDLDSPNKESIRCINENFSVDNLSSFDANANVANQEKIEDIQASERADSIIPSKIHSEDDYSDHPKEGSLTFHDSFKNIHRDHCDCDSDLSDHFFLDLDPRKNMTSSPLRSFQCHQRQKSPCNLHHQLREFPAQHIRCRPNKLDRAALDKTYGHKTTRSRRVREWLSYSHKTTNVCHHTFKGSEDDSPMRDYIEDRYIPSVAMDSRIDSSCDASGEYTTTTESDGDGSMTSSDDCFEPGRYVANVSGMGSVESVIQLERDVFSFGKTHEVPHLLLPPPPPETPPLLKKEKMGLENSDQSLPNGESQTDSEELERRRLSTLRASSEGQLNLTSSGFSKTVEHSSSTTVNEGSTSNFHPELSSKWLRRPEGTSSESSAAENKTASGARLTRSLPSILHQDSLQSSISDNYHSYPSESVRPGDNKKPSRRNQTSRGRRQKKTSSSSNRSHLSGRRRRQTVSECPTRKRHWSVVQTPLQVRIAKAADERVDEAQISPDLDRTVVASPESDLIFTTVEEQSTVSDQVWDGYQEMPYLSEAYSEPTVDEDAIRKLTEFGDDYGSAIGQTSVKRAVCNSNSGVPSLIVKEGLKIPPKEISESSGDRHDSDSDLEDLYDILTDTYKALNFAKSTYAYKKNLGNSDFAELTATCQTHLRCLKAILEHIQTGGRQENFTSNNVQLHILIKEWEVLQENLNMSKKLHTIQEEIDDLRTKIFSFSVEDEAIIDSFSSSEDLQKKIDFMEKEFSSLMAIKEGQLKTVNFRVHEFAAENDTLAPLRSEIISLYKIFQETSAQHAARQMELSKLLERWRNYCELCHHVSFQIGEREERQKEGCDVDESSHSETLASDVLKLRKEAKFFTSKLQDGCIGTSAVKEMEVLEERLQNVAKPKEMEILFPDRISSESQMTSRSACHPDLSMSPVEKADENFVDVAAVPANNKSEEKTVPVPKKKSPPSRLWRAFRASLPIQLAVVLLYCLACAFEPNCCDLINNFNFSFSPQLRYLRGPPPV